MNNITETTHIIDMDHLPGTIGGDDHEQGSFVGQMIHDYNVCNKIESGRYGTAYKVFSVRYKCYFCMKVISITDEYSAEMLRYFYQKEAETLKLVDHNNIIKLYDYFNEENNFFLITEYCEQGTLNNFLEAEGPMPIGRLKTVFKQIFEAINYIHNLNIVHRDIKPSNIAFDRLRRPKILDWGYSTIVENHYMKSFCGTFPFTSPEVMKKVPYDGKKSDMWALGVTLYMMAFGEMPWKGAYGNDQANKLLNAEFHIPQCDPSLADLLKKLIRVIPGERLTAEEALKQDFFIKGHITKTNSISPHPKLILPKILVEKDLNRNFRFSRMHSPMVMRPCASTEAFVLDNNGF